MSFLNSYRINFWGGFSTNVCTANNDDRGSFVVNPVTGKLGPDYVNKDDDDIIHELKNANPNSPTSPLASWNYIGDHNTFFRSAKVSSFGSPGAIVQSGALLNAPVSILGSVDPGNTGNAPDGSPVMVDVDSTGTSCTQLFVGGLIIGTSLDNPLLHIKYNTKGFTRSIGARGALWQMSFPYDPETWTADESNDQIKALMAEVKQAKGLVICFSTFDPMTEYSGHELLQKFKQGEVPENPMYCMTIGSIGVWHDDDFKTCVAGRELNPIRNNSPVVGDAFAIIDEQSGIASIDLLQAIASSGSRSSAKDTGNVKPNINPGPLALQVEENGTLNLLSNLTYDATNYYKTGGIVDAQLTQAQVAEARKGPLVITAGNQSVLREGDYRIENDQRGIYLDPNQTESIHFRIRQYGQSLQSPVQITFSEQQSGQLPRYDPIYADPNFKVIGPQNNQLTVNPGDSEDFTVDAQWLTGGAKQLNLSVGNTELYYIVIKTYPDDQYNYPNGIPWNDVYEEVLRYYYVIFPAMSLRFPLNVEQTVKQLGPQIQKRISDDYLNSTLFMPITRSMSPGKRQLLKDFLNQ